MDPRHLPEKALERAQSFLATAPAITEPRDSAAVLLLRAGAEAVEVFTLMRHHAMATSAGVPVFPGGLIDPQDRSSRIPWAAGEDAGWAAALELDEGSARSIVVGAVRETFEETGVLLAGPSATELAVTPPEGWVADRQRLEAHELLFEDFLIESGWGIRADLLALWSTWLTPEFESRRYRNRFFVARMPELQEALGGSIESTDTRWISFDGLIEGARDATLQVLTPQYCLSLELRPLRTPEAILGTARSSEPELVAPLLAGEGSDLWLELPRHFAELARGPS